MTRSDSRSSSPAIAAGCSRSSVSSHDTGLTGAEDVDDLDPVVEHDDVSRAARLEHAEVGPADDPRRDHRGSADRVLERDPERVEVAHRLDHRQHRPGEDAVLAHRYAVRDLDRHVAELIAAAADTGPRGCVTDERDATACGRPHE